jgi:hypothetical protein
MGKYVRILALVAATAGLMTALPTVAGAADVPVFIMSGQSNMVGRASTASIIAARPSLTATQSSGTDKVMISYNQSGGSFEWMKPGNSGGPAGCELSLGQDLATYFSTSHPNHSNYQNETVYLIKVAEGGKSLASYFNPGTGTDYLTNCGAGWRDIVTDVRAALQVIRNNGDNPVLEGFFWHQGEADSDNLSTANAYEGRLRAFIADVRNVFNDQDMPFFVGSMGHITAGGYQYSGSIIYNAEKAVSVSMGSPGGINYTGSTNPVADTYFTDLYNVLNDGLHFTGVGYVEMGDRFEATYAAMPEPATLVLMGLGAAAMVIRRRRRR